MFNGFYTKSPVCLSLSSLKISSSATSMDVVEFFLDSAMLILIKSRITSNNCCSGVVGLLVSSHSGVTVAADYNVCLCFTALLYVSQPAASQPHGIIEEVIQSMFQGASIFYCDLCQCLLLVGQTFFWQTCPNQKLINFRHYVYLFSRNVTDDLQQLPFWLRCEIRTSLTWTIYFH